MLVHEDLGRLQDTLFFWDRGVFRCVAHKIGGVPSDHATLWGRRSTAHRITLQWGLLDPAAFAHSKTTGDRGVRIRRSQKACTQNVCSAAGRISQWTGHDYGV